jgi:DNA-binding response OmpR family regulator
MCIAHLRKMIEPEPDCPRYIVTERTVGYRLLPFAGRHVA